MRIAYVVDYFAGVNGGTEGHLFRLIQSMVARGHAVELYVLRHTRFTDQLNDFVCPVHSLGLQHGNPVNRVLTYWRFRRMLIQNEVDVVHGFFNETAMILPPIVMGTGIHCFTSRRDMGIWYTRKKLLFLRMSSFLKNTVICNSAAVAELTKQKEKKSEKDVLVIYNGIDPIPLNKQPGKAAWMHKCFFSENVVNVILLANLRPVKQMEDLVRAAGKIRNAGHNIHYYLVGSLYHNEYVDYLRGLLRSWHLEEVFHIVGPLSEPRNFLPLFHIGLLTSASEGLSNTIMEYMAAGLPVIASNVGGNPELIINGYNGLLYESSNADQLAEQIQRVASDTCLRRKLGKNGSQSIIRFSINAMIDCHEKVYTKSSAQQGRRLS